MILNTRPTGYSDALDDRLHLLVRTGHALQMLDKPGGVYLRRIDQMHPDVANLLASVARATLDGDGGSIELQLNRRGKRPARPEAFIPAMRRQKSGHVINVASLAGIAVEAGADLIIVNAEPTGYDGYAREVIREPIDTAVPALAERYLG